MFAMVFTKFCDRFRKKKNESSPFPKNIIFKTFKFCIAYFRSNSTKNPNLPAEKIYFKISWEKIRKTEKRACLWWLLEGGGGVVYMVVRGAHPDTQHNKPGARGQYTYSQTSAASCHHISPPPLPPVILCWGFTTDSNFRRCAVVCC